MEINGITGINPIWDAEIGFSATNTSSAPTAAFIDIFTSAVENVKATDNEKNEMEYLLAVGDLDNPAELTIAATKAQMAVDLLVELRNKSLEAHSEIMRMSI